LFITNYQQFRYTSKRNHTE